MPWSVPSSLDQVPQACGLHSPGDWAAEMGGCVFWFWSWGDPPSILTRTAHTVEGSPGHRGGGRHVAGVDTGVNHGVPGEADAAAKGNPWI